MIAIIDYGRGNLRSVQKSFQHAQDEQEIVVTSELKVLSRADGLVLPGVGAFGDALQSLRSTELNGFITEQARAGKPLLGICLGMQLLLDVSYEFGEHEGLGLVAGSCRPLPQESGIKVPHIGWNTLSFNPACPTEIFDTCQEDTSVYFVHSYYCDVRRDEEIAARTEYGISFASALHANNIFGVQFHPEKSSTAGLRILKNYCAYVNQEAVSSQKAASKQNAALSQNVAPNQRTSS